MMGKGALQKIVNRETARWVEAGIIDSAQREKILSIYADEEAGKKKLTMSLPAIIIGLAAVLLCAGIILFYAANWRKMPPSIKLAQVFLLILAAYGGAYYCLFLRPANRFFLGRIFLLVGMVSYGAGIMLVAQIFHISSHPTNGILAWALGSLAISAVTREKWGYYLSFALFAVWNTWEHSVYNNPNYIFILVPAVLAVLFYREKAVTGTALSLLGVLYWFYQVNVHWISLAGYDVDGYCGALLALAHVPLGVVLIMAGNILREHPVVRIPARMALVIGWVFTAVPFLFLSWPIKFKEFWFPFLPGTAFHSIQLIALILCGTAAVAVMKRRGHEAVLPGASVAFAAVMMLLPLGNVTALMVATHLGLLAFTGAMLYRAYRDPGVFIQERALAVIFFLLFLAMKGFGFFALGLSEGRFFAAYSLGFVIFTVVFFLISLTAETLVGKNGNTFPSGLLNGACALAGFFIIYALSFKMRPQTSIFEASTSVLVVLFMFLAIALGLYGLLLKISRDRLPVILSAVIFFMSVTVLLISGPSLSWMVYSAIFNILLFAMTGTLIYYSTRINSKTLLNLAVAGFVLHVMTRYFDLFWDLLSGSLLFIITGIVGIAGGCLLEKNRRKLSRIIEEGREVNP